MLIFSYCRTWITSTVNFIFVAQLINYQNIYFLKFMPLLKIFLLIILGWLDWHAVHQ